MNTAKELVSIDKLREKITRELAYARREKARPFDKYHSAKSLRKTLKNCAKLARKANKQLVTLLAAGTARPISVVLAAVLPLRDVAVAHAIESAKGYIAQVRKDVAEKGLDVAFPVAEEPKFEHYSERWSAAGKLAIAKAERQNAKRRLAQRLLDDTKATLWTEGEARSAEIQFLAYAGKLEGKVGAVMKAEVEEVRGVWGESYLHVTNAGGTRDTWKTQTIVNRSVLGTLFYQWPTRRLTASSK